ncbi:MAG: hypothetical protein FD143_1003 [Ignavibacteria bacterium]|nr:MAG: hypothetical protein FD143_1003 [Ignavibacteria bacterium]KAF0161245.1 MAG: hypothetical protein FD188_1156 [Ignavibacteria bacterium]
MIKMIPINKITKTLLRLNVLGVYEFERVLVRVLKFYLYLLCLIAAAAIYQCEKIRMI